MGLGVVDCCAREGSGGERVGGTGGEAATPLMEAASASLSDAMDGVLGRVVTASTDEARRTAPPMRDHLDFAGLGELMVG